MKARHEFKHDDEYNEYLRTYFASIAMQGMLANDGLSYSKLTGDAFAKSLSRASILAADALITELNKQL